MRFVLSTVALVLVGTLAPACTLITDVDRSKIEDPNQPNPGGGEDRDGGETSVPAPSTGGSIATDTATDSFIPSEAGSAADGGLNDGGPVEGGASDGGPDAAPDSAVDASDGSAGETPAPEAGTASDATSAPPGSSAESSDNPESSAAVSASATTDGTNSADAGDAGN